MKAGDLIRINSDIGSVTSSDGHLVSVRDQLGVIIDHYGGEYCKDNISWRILLINGLDAWFQVDELVLV